jgi:hypothetical protein
MAARCGRRRVAGGAAINLVGASRSRNRLLWSLPEAGQDKAHASRVRSFVIHMDGRWRMPGAWPGGIYPDVGAFEEIARPGARH